MNKHVSVLLNEAIDLLNVKKNGVYIDGTLGRGGHSKEILKRLENGKLYCFDLDNQAIEESKENLKEYKNVVYVHDNYMNMNKYVDKVDGIILDLGVSSPQFDESERGFSYRFDGPLDMRMDKSNKLTAYEVVNHYSEEELERVFKDYGEENYSRSISKKIVEYRSNKTIETTLELVEVIKSGLPYKVLNKKGHPAKQCFQALRIEVNHELDSLKTFLDSFDSILNNDGRVSIITFHSLEDRLVKRKFKELCSVKDDKRIMKLPSEIEKAAYELLSRKAILPSEEEIETNPRSKSAKLRGVRKIWIMAKLRKRKITKEEKLRRFAVCLFGVALLSLLASSLYVGSANTSLTIKIQKMTNQINSIKADNENLNIAIAGLQNKERVYVIALEEGLELNQENVISIQGGE